jgi:hypothetical protein
MGFFALFPHEPAAAQETRIRVGLADHLKVRICELQGDLMGDESLVRRRLPLALPALLGLFGFALCVMALPGRATDAPSKPASDTRLRITTFPPAIRVGAAAAAAKDDGTNASASTKHGEATVSIDTDDDFDTVNEKLHKLPWVIPLIFLVVGSIFLTPVILLVGIIWYKLRKTRLQNDAMLALAERGVVPPAQAAEALGAGASPASVAPQVYQQAVAIRKRIVWSDLRKGVILTMAGLALSFYSMTASGSPNSVGLVLIFVGAGYVVLWWLEGRHLDQADGRRAANGSGPGASGG